MSLKFTVGDLTIHRIIEQETTFLPALDLLPAPTPELLAENRSWMREAGTLDADDVLILFPVLYREDTGKWPLGADLSERALRVRQARIRLLD
jgi:hypothetical protein